MHKLSLLAGLLLTMTVSADSDWIKNHCTQVDAITGSLKYANKNSSEVTLSTIINTHVSLRETVCFKLEKDDSEMSGDGYNNQTKTVLYSLKLTDVQQDHKVLNAYDWVIPEARNEEFFCDCPCWTGYGLRDANYCDGRLYFDLNVYDLASGKLIKELEIAYSLQDGMKHFENRINATVSVTGSVPQVITSGYYFRETSSTKMYTGIPLNSLDEWNLDKAGWLKWKNGRIEYPGAQLEQLKNRFSFHTRNCGDKDYYWDLNARFTDKESIPKQLVRDQESVKLNDVIAGSRQVVAKLRTSPRFTVYMKFSEVASVLFFYDESYLSNFEVNMQLDKYSNSFLNISLQGAAGEIHGVLREPNVVRFSLSVDSVKAVNVVKYKGLPEFVTCNEGVKFVVCLNTRKQTPICKPASVNCEKLTDFLLPDSNPNQEDDDDDDVSNKGGSIWKKIGDFFSDLGSHLNPVKWITSLINSTKDLFGWLGFIINVVIIVGLVIGLVFAGKCLFPGCWCIRCCFRCGKKRDAKEERRQKRREDYEFEIEMSKNGKKKGECENIMSVGGPSKLPKEFLQIFENRDLTSKI